MAETVQNILVIRLKAIGDVVFSLPAVNALHRHYPAAHITFLTSRENAPLLRGFRHVREVIALDRAALRRGNPLTVVPEIFRLLRGLRGGRFDLVVDLQGFGETAWLARLTGAAQRWGSVYGPGREWAYTRGIRRNERAHPIAWNLELLRQCGLPDGPVENTYALPDDIRQTARTVLAAQHLDPARPLLVIQPMTSTEQKNWPLDRYLAVAKHWRDRQVQILFLGGPGDVAALEPARAAGFCVITGQPLLVSAALTENATLMLGGDTGLGHIAIALGRRLVMPIKHTNPGATYPYAHPEWAVAPGSSQEINDVPLDAVLAATERLFPV